MTMTQLNAEVHLKRAAGLLEETDKATQELRQSARAYDSSMQADQPFLSGMVSAYKGSQNLTQRKSSLLGDIELAKQEITNAERIDPEASIQAFGGTLNGTGLRALAAYSAAQLEFAWGKTERAKELFHETLRIAELPDAHYLLGLLYEEEFKPQDALQHFERCLELDPNGEFSIAALREANAMRNYKKRFRGNWIILVVLTLFYIVPGVIYWFVKYK